MEADRLDIIIAADNSKAIQAFEQTSKAAKDLDAALDGAGKSQFGDKIASEASKGETALQSLGSKAEAVGGKLESIGAGMSNMGGALSTSLTVPIAAAVGSFTLLADKAANFQSQMGEVFTLLPGLSADMKDKMTTDVHSIANEYGFMSEQVVPALYQAISAGVPADNVFDFIGTAAKAAIGGVTDLETAVDGISTVMNAYTNESVSAERAADAMFTAVKLGKTTFGELSGEMYKVLPLANELGVGIEDVSAAFATLTSMGMPTSVAGTYTASLLKELADPAKDISKLFKELSGFSFKDFTESGGTLYEAIAMIGDELKTQDKQWIELLGAQEASAAATGLYGDTMKANTAAMQDMAGAHKTAFEGMASETKTSIARIKSELNTMAIELGDAFIPVLESVMKVAKEDLIPFLKGTVKPALENLAEWFSGLDDGTKKAIMGMTLFAAAIGPILMIIGPLVSAGGQIVGMLGSIAKAGGLIQGAGIISSISGIGTAATTAAGASGVGGLLTAIGGLGPAAWIAVGAVGLALAAYATNFGDFRDNINDVFGKLGDAAKNISVGEFEQAGRDVGDAFAKGLETVGDLVAEVFKVENWVSVADFSAGLGEGIQQGLEGLGGSLTNTGMKLGGNLMDAIKDGALNNVSMAALIGTRIIDAIKIGIEDPGAIAQMILDGINNTVVNVSTFIQNIQKQLKDGNWGQIGVDIAQTVVDGFKLINPIVGSLAQGGLDELTGKNAGKTSPQSTQPQKVAVVDMDTSKWSFSSKDTTKNTITPAGTKADPIVTIPADTPSPEKEGPSGYELFAEKYQKDGFNDTSIKKLWESVDQSKWESKAEAATKEGTKETKSSGEKIVKTLEEMKSDAYNKDQNSFTFEDKKYQWDDASNDYIQWTKAESIAAAKAKEQAQTREKAQKEVERAQEKWNKAQESYNEALIKATETKTKALGKVQFGDKDWMKKQSEIQEKYNDAVKDAKDKRDKAEAEYNNTIKASGASASNTLVTATDTLSDSTKTTGENIFKFSEPVKATGDSLNGLASDVSSIDLKGMFESLFSNVDLRSILDKRLGESAEMNRGRGADNAADREAYMAEKEKSLYAYLEQRALSAITWTDYKGASMEEAFAEGGVVWAEVAKAWLSEARSVTLSNQSYGWAQNEEIRRHLGPEDYQAIAAVLEQAKPIATAYQAGEVNIITSDGINAKDQKLWNGRESYKVEGLDKVIGATGTEAKAAIKPIENFAGSIDSLGLSTQRQEKQASSLITSVNHLNNAQSLYEKALQTGSISADDAAKINQELALATEHMGQAGITAYSPVSSLPGALQALGTSAQELINSLRMAISDAQYGTEWKTQSVAGKYKPMEGSQTSKLDIMDILNGTTQAENAQEGYTQALSNNANTATTATQMNSGLTTAMQITTQSGHGLTGSLGILTPAMSMASAAANAAAGAIASAAARIQSAAQNAVTVGGSGGGTMGSVSGSNHGVFGDWQNPYSGSGATLQKACPFGNWQNPYANNRSPCGWGVAFESGGPVTNSGPAMLHQGEYVLSRNDIKSLGNSGGKNVNLSIDMRNSRFGESELARDLPKRIAREMNRILTAGGI